MAAELKGWLRRRHQVTDAIQRTRQQLAMTLPAIRPLVRKTLAVLLREQVAVDAAIKALLQAHANLALRSSKGLWIAGRSHGGSAWPAQPGAPEPGQASHLRRTG